jgi:hypothetical protein
MRVTTCSLLAGIAFLASPPPAAAGLSDTAVEVLTRDCIARFGSDLVRECEVITDVSSLLTSNVAACLSAAKSYDIDPQVAQKLCSYYYNP